MYPLTQIYLIIRTIIGGVPSRKIDHVSPLRSALPTAFGGGRGGGDIVKRGAKRLAIKEHRVGDHGAIIAYVVVESNCHIAETCSH
jgi:hypothetical protein